MALSDLEKSEKQLAKAIAQQKALEKKIKEHKRKIDEQIGNSIIAALDLEYSSIDDNKINELCENIKAVSSNSN